MACVRLLARLEAVLLGGWKTEVWLEPGKEATQVPTTSSGTLNLTSELLQVTTLSPWS